MTKKVQIPMRDGHSEKFILNV